MREALGVFGLPGRPERKLAGRPPLAEMREMGEVAQGGTTHVFLGGEIIPVETQTYLYRATERRWVRLPKEIPIPDAKLLRRVPSWRVRADQKYISRKEGLFQEIKEGGNPTHYMTPEGEIRPVGVELQMIELPVKKPIKFLFVRWEEVRVRTVKGRRLRVIDSKTAPVPKGTLQLHRIKNPLERCLWQRKGMKIVSASALDPKASGEYAVMKAPEGEIDVY